MEKKGFVELVLNFGKNGDSVFEDKGLSISQIDDVKCAWDSYDASSSYDENAAEFLNFFASFEAGADWYVLATYKNGTFYVDSDEKKQTENWECAYRFGSAEEAENWIESNKAEWNCNGAGEDLGKMRVIHGYLECSMID